MYFLNFPISDDKPIAQYMVSVPKKNFGHAVDRNRIKRQLREAIRLEKSILEDFIRQQSTERHIFAVTYMGKKLPQYTQVSKSVQHLFQSWIIKNEKDSKDNHLSSPTAD